MPRGTPEQRRRDVYKRQQQDSAAGTGAANPHETIATSVQENPRFAKPQLDIPCRNAILISIDTGDIL